MKITINGSIREFPDGLSLAGLLGELGLTAAPVVVERNGEVVTRERFADTGVRDGDRLEIVRLVGGG